MYRINIVFFRWLFFCCLTNAPGRTLGRPIVALLPWGTQGRGGRARSRGPTPGSGAGPERTSHKQRPPPAWPASVRDPKISRRVWNASSTDYKLSTFGLKKHQVSRRLREIAHFVAPEEPRLRCRIICKTPFSLLNLLCHLFLVNHFVFVARRPYRFILCLSSHSILISIYQRSELSVKYRTRLQED